MIICLGISGSGKSMLIHYLRERCADLFQGYVPPELPEGEKPPLEPEPLLPVIATLGTDLIKLSRPGEKKTDPPETVEIREVGGGLSPLWKSFTKGNSIKAMLFVVDSGAPEKIGNATVHLVEMLNSPQLESASVMIVFNKTDVDCSRPLAELQKTMRLEQMISMSKRSVESSTFNFRSKENLDLILDWCFKFKNPPVSKDESA